MSGRVWAKAYGGRWHIVNGPARTLPNSLCGTAWFPASRQDQRSPPLSDRVCKLCSRQGEEPPEIAALRSETARLRALLDERTALLRECLPIVDAAAMSVRGYPGEETPNDLSRRIAATLKETT